MKLNKKFVLVVCCLLVAAVAGLSLSIFQHKTKVDAPINSQMRTYHYPMSLVEQIRKSPNPGELVYKSYCVSCHAEKPIIDLHAPRVGHPEDWIWVRKLGMDQAVKLAFKGYNTMPARGGCFECSDEEIKAAIVYMLGRSQSQKQGQ